MCPLASTGNAYCAGDNSVGQLGDGTHTGRETFAAVHQPAGVLFTTIAVGGDYTCALSGSGQAYCWGAGSFGQLGGASGLTPAPVLQPAGARFTAITTSQDFIHSEHTCALATDGKAYCWGANEHGQLGDGTTTARIYPVLVQAPAGMTFSAIDAGNWHTCALTTQGRPVCWGDNEYGQLGDGTYTDRARPVYVGR